jgi:hypothetical protein
MQQLPLPDLNKRASKTVQNTAERPNKPSRLIPEPPNQACVPLTVAPPGSTATTGGNPSAPVQPTRSADPEELISVTAIAKIDLIAKIGSIDSIDPNIKTDPIQAKKQPEPAPKAAHQTSHRSDPSEITSLFDLLGIGTSIATSITLGVCGYYAHELIDPEVDVALLPEIPTSDEASRLDTTRLMSLAERSGTVAIATPEFLPSVRNETRQWSSDLRRFVRALQTPRATPKLALATREITPQYPANPTIERWLDQASGVQSDPAGKHQIYLAKKHAIQGQFAAAIIELKKIPPTSPHYDLAQTKLTEYAQSRDIRARVSLQVAYDLAAAGDFSGALAFLNEIPAESSIHPTVQQKRLEYTQKRDIQAKTWLYRAKKLAIELQYDDAIALLRVIPQGTSVYGEAKQKILEYHQTLVGIQQERLEQERLEQQKTNVVPKPPEAT